MTRYRSALFTACACAAALLLAGTASASEAKVELCHVTGSASNPVVRIAVAASAMPAHLAHGDVPADCGGCGAVAPPGAPCTSDRDCGTGSFCLDDPSDACDPADGDCPGSCVRPVRLSCEDLGDCPPGFECLDDPFDDCDPDCGDEECATLCFRADGGTCRGFIGRECPDGPFLCIDIKGDACSPECEDIPCSDGQGLCVRLDEFVGTPCGGPDCLPCPEGSTCVDDFRDRCDPAAGDEGCPRICVEPGEASGAPGEES